MPFKDPDRRRLMNRIYGKKWRDTEHGRETVNRLKREHYQQVGNPNRDPQRKKAYWIVESHLKAGTLVRLSCVQCGAPKTQAHHWRGYEGDAILDVVWLCPTHHVAAHKPAQTVGAPTLYVTIEEVSDEQAA